MGLDMYLRGEKFFWTDWEKPANNRMEDSFKVSSLELELGYWRKHPNLHGYIVQTFAGGKDECQKIELDQNRLHQLVVAIRENQLPLTEGFFFGVSEKSKKQDAEDLGILAKAIAWLGTEEKGVSRTVYYHASW
jgi:hypothetical protein